MRKAGCPNAQTLHKLLYHAKQSSSGQYFYKPREHLDGNYKIIIVDEVSMCPLYMWKELLKHRVHVIALGDPFQLPAIFEGTSVLDSPHIFLDEIMRQAKESDIIQMSMKLRNFEPLVPYQGNDINILQQKEFCTGMYEWADQILCATNNTCTIVNDFMRNLKGFNPTYPQIGDKIMCLHNSWNKVSEIEAEPLINGTIGYISHIYEEKRKYYIGLQKGFLIKPVYLIDLDIDNDIYYDICIDKQFFETGKKTFSPATEYAIRHDKRNELDMPIDFNYCYAATTHKFQGSQAPRVLVIEERFPFDRETHYRHLYTSLTRAEKKVTLILK